MRALVQRVTQARVTVAGEPVGEIGPGLLVLVGVTHDDTATVASRLADKVGNLRVFDDDEGIMNRTLLDVGGSALVVSQFTLYGDTTRGRRPSWVAGPRPRWPSRCATRSRPACTTRASWFRPGGSAPICRSRS